MLTGFDELVRLHPNALPGLGERIPEAPHLIETEHAMVGTDRPGEIQFEFRASVFECRVQVPAVARIDCGLNDLQVLSVH
jgi:hypothetical protein